VATGCGGNGFSVSRSSNMSGRNMRAASNQQNGFGAWGASYLWAQDATSVNNQGTGFGVWGRSMAELGASDLANGATSVISGNLGSGLNVHQGAYAVANGVRLDNNAFGGASVGSHGGLEMDDAVVTNSAQGPGVSAGGMSTVFVSRSRIENNAQGGVMCGASYCVVQQGIVKNNGAIGTFGLNGFWGAWIDAWGTVVSGHRDPQGNPTWDTNEPRTSNPTNWTTIYDQAIPPN
jgi:hypothetical protein